MLSSAAIKSGSYTTAKQSGWSTFNATILSDLAVSDVINQLDNVFFTLKVRVEGADNTLIDLNTLDLQCRNTG
jgi:hypothetical protein